MTGSPVTRSTSRQTVSNTFVSFPPASSLQALIDHIDVASKREYGKTLVVNHGQAKLFFVSGAASHATATTQNGAQLTGSAALTELIDLCARTVSLEWEDDNNDETPERARNS